MTTRDWMRHTWGWDAHGFKGVAGGFAFRLDARRTSAVGEFEDLDCGVAPERGERPQGCGPERLIAFLRANETSPSAARALAALRDEILPPGGLDLLTRHPKLASQQEIFYCQEWRRRAHRVETALRHPALAIVLPRAVARIYDRNAVPLRVEARDLLAGYAPHASPGSIRSVLRMDLAIPTTQVLDALLALPPERHPRGEAEHRAFEAIVMESMPVADLLGGHGHLASAGNGWQAYARLLARRLPPGSGLPSEPLPGEGGPCPHPRWPALGRACQDARDVAVALSRQVLVPLLHDRGDADEQRLLHLSGVGIVDIPESRSAATRAAARMLMSGKSLPAILELSTEWHARRRAMEAALADVADASPPPEGVRPVPGTWPVPFPPVAAPNGVEIAFLGSQAELAAEGSVTDRDGIPGLDHCVSGYGMACASGQSAIASLRLRRGKRVERLSTAEVAVEARTVRVLQHRGLGNGGAPRAAEAALAWFEAEVRSGRLVPRGEYTARGWRLCPERGSISGRCGYDHRAPGAVEAALDVWSPLLTRPMRDAGTLHEQGRDALLGIEREDLKDASQPAPRPLRRASLRAYDRYCRAILLPLKLGERAAIFLEDLIPVLPREPFAVTFALAIEAALLWGIHALAGHAWLGLVALQALVPAFLVAQGAFRFPRVLGRTLSHAAHAASLNASRPAAPEGTRLGAGTA